VEVGKRMNRNPAYKENDVVIVEIVRRDSFGFVKELIKEVDTVFRLSNSGVHLLNRGFLQYDRMFPQWSVRKATDEELLPYKLENPDACL
jgi:hypothetical protein